MFSQTAQYYDKIYAFKDYYAETTCLRALIDEHLRSGSNRLLDVACGTGRHIEYLKTHFEVEGVDLDAGLLESARQRNPTVALHCADMTAFDLGRTFDVVTCLFSSIGYVKTLENLARAIACMAHHLKPGGLLLVEPWFTPGTWHPDTVHAVFIDEPELKIARINTSFVDGRVSFFDLHYLIGTPAKTEHCVEHHELGLFEQSEMLEAFTAAGLDAIYDENGLTGRGLYIGRKPLGHPGQ